MSKWTLFSNHGHVLFCLVKDPATRLRDVATEVGITERAVQKIVRDLQDAGMVNVVKDGRRNSYNIDTSQPLRHELEAHCTVADLIDFIGESDAKDSVGTKPAALEDTRQRVEPPAMKPPRAFQPDPKPVQKPGPQPAATPAPVPRPAAVKETPAEPEPAPEPQAAPAPASGAKPQGVKKKPKKKADTENLVERQQGSLF